MAKRRTQTTHPSTHEHPRMQLRRAKWTNLNGRWDFGIDATAAWTSPDQVNFARTILVPFAPETPASGVSQTDFYHAVWYRRIFERPQLDNSQRLILHFGAVDYQASVWVNDSLAATHQGGYTPFCADITDLLSGFGEQTIIVRAFDDPQDLSKPRGKQDWHLDPHSIWYYRTTGIWQTVWMEVVPRTRIESLRWTPQMDRWSIDLRATFAGPLAQGSRLRVSLTSKMRPIAQDVYSISQREVARTITIPDGGIDDYRNDLLWSPSAPNLIDAQLDLLDADDRVIDSVQSYTAMRSVAAEGGRFLLNGRAIDLRLVLDQGYWQESGLTAPDDAALRRDVELVKKLGFNGVRKHQKIEDPRFLYWADVLGLMVWEEMPSAYRFSDETIGRVTN
jgi:beta-galactosidase/beta-glucuronidase